MNLINPSLHISVLSILGASTVLAFYAGQIVRKVQLPSIIGYMVLGVILGPAVLNIYNESIIKQLSFITEIALGFVAFSIGSELRISSLRSLGSGIVYIILSESFAAFSLVAILIYILTKDLPLALIFGSMAPASAPAGTVAVIQEYKAKGNLTKALYAVVGFDDGLAIIIFGFAAAIAKSLLIAEVSNQTGAILPALLTPLKEISLSITVGTIIGVIFCQLVRRLTGSREMFILVFAAVLFATGISATLHLSLIMTNMVVGFVLVNTCKELLVRKVVNPLSEIMPLLFILFFCLAGSHLELARIASLGTIGIVYIIGRSVGLMGGAYLGGMIGHVDEKVKKYVGMGILSQAGVAIGLSLVVTHEFNELYIKYDSTHARDIGTMVLTSITATCIFFEIIGPILTKIALKKAGEIDQDNR
jgi:Kef-type K+ transport system membrane component KefB